MKNKKTILAKLNKYLYKGEKGYTLIELLLTIFIMGVILAAVTLLLITLVRLTIKADSRRQVRQDVEYALEIIRRDLRNSDPSLSLLACDPYVSYDLLISKEEAGEDENNQLDLILTSQEEQIVYKTVVDPEGFSYIVREYTRGDDVKITELTSPNINVSTFYIKCNWLIKGNKMLTIDLGAESVMKDKDGSPVVEEVLKKTGVTIRNTDY